MKRRKNRKEKEKKKKFHAIWFGTYDATDVIHGNHG